MIHGFTWHSGYFANAAAALNHEGFAVVSFDLYAHGLSGSLGGKHGKGDYIN
jgi:alpha-beta hydrolase superfamily lysophospholipase